MAKQTDCFLPRTIQNAGVTIVPADTTARKTVYTASADDAIVKGLSCVSDDTAAVNLRVIIDIGGTEYQIGTVNIPIASGTNGTANAVDVLNSVAMSHLPLDRNGKRILPLEAGAILKVAALVTVTAAKTVTVVANIEEY
jgi:hypothetical protein